jgi:hypothetical protein
VHVTQTGQAPGSAAPAYVIHHVVSFDGALEAGRFFQARPYRWYQVALTVGLVAGIALTLSNPDVGLPIPDVGLPIVLT